MRVDRLYIFCANKDDTEMKEGVDALLVKSWEKCNNMFIYKFTPGNSEPELDKMDHLNSFQLSRSVGVYMIGHISSDFGGAYDANALAQKLEDILGEDFAKIQKLSMIVCKSADKPNKKNPLDITGDKKVDLSEISAKYSRVLRFLRALSEKGCNPMIAGYDNFVSIFPAMGSNATYTDANSQIIHASDPQHEGKKIFIINEDYSKYSLAKNSFDAGKRVFYIKDGKVQVASPELWSDKI